MKNRMNRKKRSGLSKPVVLAVMVGAAVVLTTLFLLSQEAFSHKFLTSSLVIESDKSTEPSASPADEVTSNNLDKESAGAGKSAELGTKRFDFRLSTDDTFYGLMSLFNVSGTDIHKIARKARPLFNLSRLRKGTVFRVYTEDGLFNRAEYRLGEFDILTIKKEPAHVAGAGGIGYTIETRELPWEIKENRAFGVINNSLYEAGIKAGTDPQTIMNLSDILAWDVDFASDIRKGDTFGVVHEKIFVEGKYLKTGKILGAEMMNNGKRVTAIYFEDSEGGTGYYDENGKSLRRTLLRSPLRYRRISSYFSKGRYHPILKRYRPHHGIDYAAPTGTPVESAGSGKVIFAGWKSGYGNFVTIKHNNSYTTSYGHFSRIKKGIRKGVKVEQAQVIGYVGSTGISTGPHLHYEVKRGKKLINPLSIRPKANSTVPKVDRERFEVVKEEMLARLSGQNAGVVVSSRSGATAEQDG